MNGTTIARPYAKAILQLADSNGLRAQWGQDLENLALVVSDPLANYFLSDLSIKPSDKADFLVKVLGDNLSEGCKNLLRILAKNKRLLIIPELCLLYQKMRRKLEHQLPLRLTTAEQLDNTYLQKINLLFDKQFSEQVILEHAVDGDLLGGAVLKIGDRVIDASIKNRLKTFHNYLSKR